MIALGGVCCPWSINAIFYRSRVVIVGCISHSGTKCWVSESWTVIHCCVMLSWFDWNSKATVCIFKFIRSICEIWVHLLQFGFAEIMICRVCVCCVHEGVCGESDGPTVIDRNHPRIVSSSDKELACCFQVLS